MTCMVKKTNSRFSFALTSSIILHVTLIAILGYSAWQYSSPYSGDVKGESIDAIMVDSSIMSEQYQRQLQHQLTSQQVKQQQQQQIEQQAKELQQQQLEEQQRLKAIEKERLLTVEKQKQEADALAKALAEKQKTLQEAENAKVELEERQKQALIAKQKADEAAQLRIQQEQEAKKKALEEQQKIKEETDRIKAELAEKEKQKQQQLKEEKEAKQKALQEQQQKQQLDDILGGLTSNAPKSQQGVSSAEVDRYKSQVNNAIKNKFINPKLYSGMHCVLKIQLASDGLLINVTAIEGDDVLCREAIAATKKASFPKLTNLQLFKQVSNMTVDFIPN